MHTVQHKQDNENEFFFLENLKIWCNFNQTDAKRIIDKQFEE